MTNYLYAVKVVLLEITDVSSIYCRNLTDKTSVAKSEKAFTNFYLVPVISIRCDWHMESCVGQYKMQGETKHGETQCTYDFVSPRQAGGLAGWSSDAIHSPTSQFSAAAARSISTSISATAHSSTSPSSSLSKSGRFFSPRFPQNYPPQSACYYQFHAWSNERIQIQFMTIDLEPTDQRSGLACTPDLLS
jgi:CUB domain